MPDFTRYVRARLRPSRLSPERETEIVEELALQLRQRYESALATGTSDAEALGAAEKQFPDWERLAREIELAERPVASRLPQKLRPTDPPSLGASPEGGFLPGLWHDLRYAFRVLKRSPGFTAVAVLTLALGVGANTAIFSVVNAVLLRGFPYAEPDRLVVISETYEKGERTSVAYPNYVDWVARARSFVAMAAYRAMPFNLTGVERAMRLDGRQVTYNFFDVLGIEPQLGRAFLPEDESPDAPRTAVISSALWQRQFGGDANVLGRTLTLDETPFVVIGVLPRDFEFTARDDVYTPLAHWVRSQTFVSDRGNHVSIYALARLAPGVTLTEADTEMRAIAADLEREYPNTNSGGSARVQPLVALIVEDLRTALLILMGAVVGVLLIGCVNLANLLLARGAAREQELQVRAALGAGRFRIIRQLLTESVLVSTLGGTLGLLVAYATVPLLTALVPSGASRLADVRLDGAVLGFTFAVSILTGVVFGLAPALRASGAAAGSGLRGQSRSPGGTGARSGLRNALLIAEVGLAFVLLVGAGLMLRTVAELSRVDPGFDPSRLLTLRFNTPVSLDEGRRTAFYREVIERVEAIPGVNEAALTLALPIEGSEWGSVFIVADRDVPPRPELPSASFTPVSTGYFRAMKISLMRGREFDERDDTSAPHVVVINETFARRFWPDEDPVGKRVKQGWPESKTPWREVVGVVADVKQEGVDQPTRMEVFVPLSQEPFRSLRLVVRTAMAPAAVAPEVERAVHSIEKDLPLYAVRPMADVMAGAIGRQRLVMTLLSTFAGLALLLAAVGVFGVTAYSISQRRHEVGIRMALGAAPGDVLRLVLGQGVRLAVAGVALGLSAAWLVTRLLSSLLFRVEPADPVTFAAVAAVLAAVAVAACYLPARRATRVDPTTALRAE